MKAVVFASCGDPAAVLRIEDRPLPEPRRGEVLIKMLACPINPSDLMYIQGRYGKKPALPAVPGFEGVGIVERSGGGLLGRLRTGARVAVPSGTGGNWQQFVVQPAHRIIPVPASFSDEAAASFFVNPASALVMTQRVLKIPAGAWALQTAAGSQLGRMVIRLGRLHGFKTINVVRRREQVAELQQLGADAVICTADEDLEKRVHELTAGQGVPYALDAVGGATGSAVVRTLAPDGRMLLYGTLADEPITFDSRTLMTGQKRIEGFWLSNWAATQGPLTMVRLFRQIKALLTAGTLGSETGQVYPLERVQEAVAEAARPGHKGKVFLRFAG